MVATVPAVEGVDSWGYPREEAVRHVQEALELEMMLEVLQEDGESIPEELDMSLATVEVALKSNAA
jgi:predicted RNase H-like HicB family nuclease